MTAPTAVAAYGRTGPSACPASPTSAPTGATTATNPTVVAAAMRSAASVRRSHDAAP